MSDLLGFFCEYGNGQADYDTQAIFTVGCVLVCTTLCICCCVITERPSTPEQALAVPGAADGYLAQMRVGFMTAPDAISSAWTVQFFHFVSFFTIFTFGTDYFGEFVYQGDAEAQDGSLSRENYNDGVRAGNAAMGLHTLVASVSILSLPLLIPRIGIRPILYFTNAALALTLTLLACLEHTNRWTATMLFASMGLAWGATITLPWYIVARVCVELPNRGIYNG